MEAMATAPKVWARVSITMEVAAEGIREFFRAVELATAVHFARVLEAQEDLRADKNLGVYKGALYENAVGEALFPREFHVSFCFIHSLFRVKRLVGCF